MSEIHLFNELDSTNVQAREKFADAKHGETWIADFQTAGRGRRAQGGDHKSWFSPAGLNIYMSVVVKMDLAADVAPILTLAAGAYVVEVLNQNYTKIEGLWVKWPNDLYVGQRKLAGILTEGVFNSSGFQGAVVGIGLNVNLLDGIPEELLPTLTSLAIETGKTFDRMKLALDMQKAIVDAADSLQRFGPNHVVEKVQSYDGSKNLNVIVTVDGAEVQGTSLGIAPNGTLRVAIDPDTVVEVRTGEAKLIL